MPNPDASSTPSNLRIRGRKGIHEHNTLQNISNASPIRKATPKDCFGLQQIGSVLDEAQESTEARTANPKFQNRPHNMWSPGFSEGFLYSSDSEHSDSQSSDERDTCPDSGNEFIIKKFKYCFGALVMAFLIVATLSQYTNDQGTSNKLRNYSIEDLELKFNKQDKHFWPSIRVNVQEILEFHRPRVIIFLYENDSLAIAENIVASVSKVAVCLLSDCSRKPIDIEGSILSPVEIQDDFGTIVSNYREKLENSGVFIIRNLHLVPGKSAQALHLFCDEYHPVIERALFLFTVQVDELPDKYAAASFLESLLLKAWNDIGVHDKFYPLFTRISGTVLTVRPE